MSKKIWTYEKCREEALKYKNRQEFRKGNKEAYFTSKNKKILNELFKNHINNGYSKNYNLSDYWTKEKLQEEANKYQTILEFKKCNISAYCFSVYNNFIDELFKNHTNNVYIIKKYYHWSKDKIQEEANKYQTRGDFQKNNKLAYYAAIRNNIVNDIFKNHINNGYSNINDHKKSIYVIYVYELIEYNIAYIGLTNNIDRRDKEHLFDKTKSLNKFCIDNNISLTKYKILEKDLSSMIAKEQEKYWLIYYKNNNWKMFNLAKPGSLGGIPKKWNLKILKKEVNKYKTRGEFNKNNRNAYKAAMRMKILDKLFENHQNNGYSENRKPNNYWSKEKLQEESNKYKTRIDFIKNSYGAYCSAKRMKILNELFKNHINNGFLIIKNKNNNN